MIKQSFIFITISLLLCILFAEIPPVPNPPKIVNDFANILSVSQINHLERQLVDFNDSTSNLICVVIVNDLGGFEASQFAFEIGEKWGVRDKSHRNGIVFLIKPRTSTPGEVFIATGYDLEGVLPDAIVKRIINNEIIPYFAEGKYYEGIENGINTLIPVIRGEIPYKRKADLPQLIISLVIFIATVAFVIIFITISKKGNNRKNNNGKDDIWKYILAGSLLSGNKRGGSSWSGGASKGGFGGFGGSGGFGGGGAGGRF